MTKSRLGTQLLFLACQSIDLTVSSTDSIASAASSFTTSGTISGTRGFCKHPSDIEFSRACVRDQLKSIHSDLNDLSELPRPPTLLKINTNLIKTPPPVITCSFLPGMEIGEGAGEREIWSGERGMRRKRGEERAI